ncbi:MAG: YicC family protein [Lachnospiraceae bacterium]|nr:YicC family protein [Lachnospiraceae bacterium]
MIRSMTGYGRCETADDERKITVEIKAVNNRYADFNIRMPRRINALESKIRNLLKEHIFRGKVDIYITLEEYGDKAGALVYNEALAAEYVSYMRKIGETFGLDSKLSVTDIAKAPDVLTLGTTETDTDLFWNLLSPVIREAADNFNEARELEGGKLKNDLLLKLDSLEAYTDQVIAHEPEIMAAYRKRIEETVTELLEDRSLDESRIAAECVLFADKICTDEETVRLKSHIQQMKKELDKNGSIGRKLDFLAQEMNREANTTLSKAGDLITADLGIAMKTEIEKIREQIQNIE